MSNQSGKIVLILVLFLLLLAVVVYFIFPQTPTYFPDSGMDYKEAGDSSDGMKDYYSKALKINFVTPKEAKIEEKFNMILINLPAGKISVNFNGTNFENAKGYFEDLKKKHNLQPKEYSEGVYKKYDYVMTLGEDPNDKLKDKRTYFIYSDYAVYIFSTSDETLHPVLDQIVQSFEYKP